MVAVVLLDALVILVVSAKKFRAVDVRTLKIGRLAVASLPAVAGSAAHAAERRALQVFAGVEHLAVVMAFVAITRRQIGTFVAVFVEVINKFA